METWRGEHGKGAQILPFLSSMIHIQAKVGCEGAVKLGLGVLSKSHSPRLLPRPHDFTQVPCWCWFGAWLYPSGQAAVLGPWWWCLVFMLKAGAGSVVQKKQSSIYLKGSQTRWQTHSVCSEKAKKKEQSKALLNFEPFLGVWGPFYTAKLSLALLTLLMDIVAPQAYLV